MKTIKVQSKSNPTIFREVRIKHGLAGERIFECSCPANVWFRISNGRNGKEICRHIEFVKRKIAREKQTVDKETKKSL